jgi:hypothetical protein
MSPRGRRGSFLWVRQPLGLLHARALLTCLAENNPEVMSALVHKLGLSQKLAFHDVFSIDEPELLAFVPRPAHALLLVFPVSETYEKFRRQEDQGKPEYHGHGDAEEVVWYKQTIANACGLIGLLHGVSNGTARANIRQYFNTSYTVHTLTDARTQLRLGKARSGCHPAETS